MATLSTLLTATYVLSTQQCKGNELLRFHCNNSYVKPSQCYVIRTLPNLCYLPPRPRNLKCHQAYQEKLVIFPVSQKFLYYIPIFIYMTQTRRCRSGDMGLVKERVWAPTTLKIHTVAFWVWTVRPRRQQRFKHCLNFKLYSMYKLSSQGGSNVSNTA
jgi:hypothetical protein